MAHSPARRDSYLLLPPEDEEEGMCGKLNKAVSGKRVAAQNRGCECVDFMVGVGVVRGISSPCTFRHPTRDLRAVIHGDDFTILGWES